MMMVLEDAWLLQGRPPFKS